MLKGKTAIITGGVRGIGKAIAVEFCKNGADVVISYRSNEEAAKQAATELEQYGTKVITVKGDITDPNHGEELAKITKDTFGKIDILVNNAGITKDGLMMRMSAADFKSVVDTNLNGTFYCTKAVTPIMIKQKSGTIINLSSIVGVKGNPGQVNYSASKAGIIGLTLSAAKELGRRNIRVNAIAPGFIDTEMTKVLTEEQKSKMLEAISLGRLGKPEDIGKTAVFLASEGGEYITGQVITVDGGMSI